jgi:Uma2 family endonuclease
MAIVFHPITPPTDEELMQLHELNGGYSVERLADGSLLVTPNGAIGDFRNAELVLQLMVWSKATKLGPTLGPTAGYRLPDSSVFAPDGSFIRAERWNTLSRAEREDYFHGAPDAVFEIRSKSGRHGAQVRKCETWSRAGARLVVLVDPYEKTVDRWLDGVHEELGTVSPLDCDPVMPGFVLDVAALLAV